MKELEEYRANLLKKLEQVASDFRAECLKVGDPQARRNAADWTLHQIAAHTRTVDELVYGLRVRQTAEEQNPEFPNFDGEAYMAAHYDSSEALEQVLNRFVGNVRTLAEWLRSLPTEAWSRVSRHTTLGSGITLQAWVEKDLAHIEAHLKDVKSLQIPK